MAEEALALGWQSLGRSAKCSARIEAWEALTSAVKEPGWLTHLITFAAHSLA